MVRIRALGVRLWLGFRVRVTYDTLVRSGGADVGCRRMSFVLVHET